MGSLLPSHKGLSHSGFWKILCWWHVLRLVETFNSFSSILRTPYLDLQIFTFTLRSTLVSFYESLLSFMMILHIVKEFWNLYTKVYNIFEYITVRFTFVNLFVVYFGVWTCVTSKVCNSYVSLKTSVILFFLLCYFTFTECIKLGVLH